MKDLPPLLQAIPNLHHAIYADDLTLWVSTGSLGDQQDALQAAIQVTQQCLQPTRVRPRNICPSDAVQENIQEKHRPHTTSRAHH
ncbi:hypothetical protein HPB47_022704 [Ixodes persulcatus]|uniref:Uncharacterized protein n=1 Tax=Ixodes persulcatus TaxID=34615 RepID=A0AC60Q9R6_IXOPE|nr:hypothetical protein HPB47_022704 [Ixodes persulcatus]